MTPIKLFYSCVTLEYYIENKSLQPPLCSMIPSYLSLNMVSGYALTNKPPHFSHKLHNNDGTDKGLDSLVKISRGCVGVLPNELVLGGVSSKEVFNCHPVNFNLFLPGPVAVGNGLI